MIHQLKKIDETRYILGKHIIYFSRKRWNLIFRSEYGLTSFIGFKSDTPFQLSMYAEYRALDRIKELADKGKI